MSAAPHHPARALPPHAPEASLSRLEWYEIHLLLVEVMELPTLAERRNALAAWPDWLLFFATSAQQQRQPESHAMDLLRSEAARRGPARREAAARWLARYEKEDAAALEAHRKRGGKFPPRFPCSMKAAALLITQEPKSHWPAVQRALREIWLRERNPAVETVLQSIRARARNEKERDALLAEATQFPKEVRDMWHFASVCAVLWPYWKEHAPKHRDSNPHRRKGARGANRSKARKAMPRVIAAWRETCREHGIDPQRLASLASLPQLPKLEGIGPKRARGLIDALITALGNPDMRASLLQTLRDTGWRDIEQEDADECFLMLSEKK